MFRLLVPIDGSDISQRAVDHILMKLGWYKEKDIMDIHLLNVQHPVSGDVSTFVNEDELKKYHHDEGIKALEYARAKLDAAGVLYTFHIGVGDPAHVIVHYAKEKQIDQIVMGTHGRAPIASMLMGSTTTKVLHLTKIPILLVR
jgi:nucleotide-binding universal stress UspA family protein